MSLQFSKAIVQKLKSKIAFFANFVEEEIVELLKLASHREYKAGEVIFLENSEGSEMFVILSGDVKISKASEAGLDIVLANLTSGDCFGEMSLIDGSKRSARATADTDLNLMILKEEVLKYNLGLAYKLFKNFSVMMANRLRVTNKSFLETSADETKHRGRFTEVLKKYAERGGSFDNTNLRDSTLSAVNFTNSSLKNTNMVLSKLKDCRINNSSFEQAVFTGSTFDNAVFSECNFNGSNFSAANFEKVVFKNCFFQEAVFKNLIAKGVTITNPQTT